MSGEGLSTSQPTKNKVKSYVGLVLISMVLGLGLFAGLIVWQKLSFDSRVAKASERLDKVGVNLFTGRRGALGFVRARTHDPTFGRAKLRETMPVLSDLDKDSWVTEIWLELNGAGIGDEDVGAMRGLRKLKGVDLSDTAVTQDGVNELLKYYPGIMIETNSPGRKAVSAEAK
jgi:hypothetical protein